MQVSLTVNGNAVTQDVDTRTLLVNFLRENLRLTGTHVGCDTSQCGACVVHIDGKSVKSCTTLAVACEGEGHFARADLTAKALQDERLQIRFVVDHQDSGPHDFTVLGRTTRKRAKLPGSFSLVVSLDNSPPWERTTMS